jgi:hypothetical protein
MDHLVFFFFFKSNSGKGETTQAKERRKYTRTTRINPKRVVGRCPFSQKMGLFD